MIRPVSFRMNEQTAVNNYYQHEIDDASAGKIQATALKEFDAFVDKLRSAGVRVIVVEDLLESDTPDSIFPNNWVSFHRNGMVGVFPMFAPNRRLERREDIFDIIEKEGFEISEIIDYSSAEADDIFLEATGSIVLDRENHLAYCALSPRADEELFIEFCEDFEYTPVVFTANQSVAGIRKPIYHTNVMMCLGETFAVICLDSIDDKKEKKNVVSHLKQDGKEIIAITEQQMHHFAGNMLQVMGMGDRRYLAMSTAAHDSLSQLQLEKLKKHCEIVHSSLDTIETCGGGSARCMMAEVFLPKG